MQLPVATCWRPHLQHGVALLAGDQQLQDRILELREMANEHQKETGKLLAQRHQDPSDRNAVEIFAQHIKELRHEYGDCPIKPKSLDKCLDHFAETYEAKFGKNNQTHIYLSDIQKWALRKIACMKEMSMLQQVRVHSSSNALHNEV